MASKSRVEAGILLHIQNLIDDDWGYEVVLPK